MTKQNAPIERKVTIDQQTGDQIFSYYYKTKKCRYRLISNPISKQYIGYCLIKNDLENAREWLTLAYDFSPRKDVALKSISTNYYYDNLGTRKNTLIVKSLFYSSLIFYGKCFTQAKGRGIKLEKSIIPQELGEKHDLIMEYRHSLAAHSGEGRWDTGSLNLIIPPKNECIEEQFIIAELNILNFEDDRDNDHNFLDLIDSTLDEVTKKIEIIGGKIMSKIADHEKES